jgi:drug/metabolite transporter (DMT)-like permease
MDIPADRRVLPAFAGVVALGGTNLVLVVLSTRELDPFWSAAMRFGAAAILAFAIARRLGVPMPTGRDLAVSVVYGALAIYGAFALFYWGTQRVPAGIASVILGMLPLLTFLLSMTQRIERFRWRGLVGAVLAVVGIAIVSARPSEDPIPTLSLLAVVASAVSGAQGTITIRRIVHVHPLAVNAVALACGGVLLLATSFAAGETWEPPSSAHVWVALSVMVATTPLLFVLFVFVVQRWSATAASYQFVLFPLVSIVLAAILLDEPVSASLLIGAPFVLLGVYVGALARGRHRAEPAAEPASRR